MPRVDLRKQLEAMAEGKRLADVFGKPSIIYPALVDKHQSAFVAWHRFAHKTEHGEPLSAPGELLTPLP